MAKFKERENSAKDSGSEKSSFLTPDARLANDYSQNSIRNS